MKTSEGKNVGKTFGQVKVFQLVRASQGKEDTSLGWQPGKTTLKPGPDLIGKAWKADMAFE